MYPVDEDDAILTPLAMAKLKKQLRALRALGVALPLDYWRAEREEVRLDLGDSLEALVVRHKEASALFPGRDPILLIGSLAGNSEEV